MKIILPSLMLLVFFADGAARWVAAQSLTTPAAPAGVIGAAQPSVALAAAGPGNALAPAMAQDAEALLDNMKAGLDADRSIAARVRLHADMFGNQMIGTGVYLQQGTGEGRQTRLELKLPVGERLATFQQICDGKYLWQLNDVNDKPSLTRIDVEHVKQASADGLMKAPSDSLTAILQGGLPKFGQNLRRSFAFVHAEAGQLDTLPVWIVQGVWRPEALAPIAPELAKQAAEGRSLDLSKLPAQMPEQVLLYLGQDDYFPYRIEYRRRPTKPGKSGVAASSAMSSMLIIELYEVRLNGAIDPQQFVYQPSGVDVVDATEQMVKGTGK